MADQRDGITWVVLELTRQGEKLVEEGTLAKVLRKLLGVPETWPVFVPAKVYRKKERSITIHLMEGYAFVASGLEEILYFRLEQSKYVEMVISSRGLHGIRQLDTLSNKEISGLKTQLSEEVAADITPGMKVVVTEGTYSKLEGIVLDVEADHAVIHFELRSIKVIAKVPKVFLETA